MMPSLHRARVFVGFVVAAVLVLPVLAGCVRGGSIRPVGLTCEYRVNPVGIGATTPRLGWMLEATRAGATDLSQSSYRVVAAASAADLERGVYLWDSGVVSGRRTVAVPYEGKALGSRERVCWRVRVVDQDGAESAWSDVATFSMGLLERGEWKGEWIGVNWRPAAPLTPRVREEMRRMPWIAPPGGATREGQEAWFRGEFVALPGAVERALLLVSADQFAEVRLNGVVVQNLNRWDMLRAVDVTAHLQEDGFNVLAAHVVHEDGFRPVLSGAVVLSMKVGTEQRVAIDGSFRSARAESAGWDAPGIDASGWAAVEVAGSQPWGGSRNTEHAMAPVTLLRAEFDVAAAKRVRRAVLYSTALGVYRATVNGVRVGDDELSPGWTEYSKRVYHQTYDVTALIAAGRNCIGVELGDGWYASMLGFTGRREFYGGKPRFLGQLEVEYTDGTREVVASGGAWRAAESAFEYADLYMGVSHDARREIPGWNNAGFDDGAWKKVSCGLEPAGVRRSADVTAAVRGKIGANGGELKVAPEVLGDPAYGVVKSLHVKYSAGGEERSVVVKEGGVLRLPGPGERGPIEVHAATFAEPEFAAPVEPLVQPQPGEPVRAHEVLSAKSVTRVREGRFVYDLGQNMVGVARVTVRGRAGQRVTLRHAEMLNPDGTIYTSNLRGATATDFFTLRDGEQTLEPLFTFHGFRYVEVSGVDVMPGLGDVKGVVLHTSMEPAGEFETSHAGINQLVHNIVWGQKGNYLDIPTDCPQRDERFGWTGDAQFFAKAAGYNFDISSFMSRWLVTLAEDAQLADGTFAHVAPKVNQPGGSTAWGDAAIVCAFENFARYGDVAVLREHYAAFKRYMAWLDGKTTGGIARVGGFGDWLNLNDPTSQDLIDTAYRAQLLGLMEQIAREVNGADAEGFAAKKRETVGAFRARFVAEDGSLRESGQTGYALVFTIDGLLDDAQRNAAAPHFREAVARRRDHLATGFIGTPRLLPALFNAGLDDVAGKLLLNEDYPSWLYQVKLGATTMWERWNGWTPEQGFADVGMNSFNHYAFGSVGEALYEKVAGISSMKESYGSVLVFPRPVKGLDHVRAVYRSASGPISCAYTVGDGWIDYEITVAPNCRAALMLPAESGGLPVVAREVGSGTWRIRAERPRD